MFIREKNRAILAIMAIILIATVVTRVTINSKRMLRNREEIKFNDKVGNSKDSTTKTPLNLDSLKKTKRYKQVMNF